MDGKAKRRLTLLQQPNGSVVDEAMERCAETPAVQRELEAFRQLAAEIIQPTLQAAADRLLARGYQAAVAETCRCGLGEPSVSLQLSPPGRKSGRMFPTGGATLMFSFRGGTSVKHTRICHPEHGTLDLGTVGDVPLQHVTTQRIDEILTGFLQEVLPLRDDASARP